MDVLNIVSKNKIYSNSNYFQQLTNYFFQETNKKRTIETQQIEYVLFTDLKQIPQNTSVKMFYKHDIKHNFILTFLGSFRLIKKTTRNLFFIKFNNYILCGGLLTLLSFLSKKIQPYFF